MKTWAMVCVVGVFGTFVSACSGDEGHSESTVDVTIPGPYQVGQRETSVTYRPEGLDEDRTLRLVLWYPTDETDGVTPLFGESLIDAAPIAEGEFPVLVYSHGTTSFAECAYSLMEYFASHGFVVASADHTGDNTSDVGIPRTTEMYLVRPQDVSAVIDTLYALPAEDPLAGRLTDDVVLAGHSYGGFTAFATVGAKFDEALIDGCESDQSDEFCSTMNESYAEILRTGFNDTRVKALIPMAPGNAAQLGPAGVSNVTIPILHMTSTLDGRSGPDNANDPYWDAINSAGSMRVNYDKGGHHSYILTCEITPWVAGENGGGCGDENTDHATLIEATNVYSLAFARRHLFGDEAMDSILNGESSTYEDVTLMYK